MGASDQISEVTHNQQRRLVGWPAEPAAKQNCDSKPEETEVNYRWAVSRSHPAAALAAFVDRLASYPFLAPFSFRT